MMILVNNFIKEASKLTYDNGVVAVLEQVVDFVNSNKTRWQIASACENIQAQQTSYNMLNLNAAKQAEKLIDLNEDEAVKYIKAGAFKNIMFCEAFRSIAKSVFKNQPMMEANADYTTIHPISIVEKNGEIKQYNTKIDTLTKDIKSIDNIIFAYEPINNINKPLIFI